MPKQSRPDDEKAGTIDRPNDTAAKEPAEGSRENVNTRDTSGGGVTNRPLEEERQEQQHLPPRGTSKDGSHA
jgi:hypothetical protein